MEEKEMSFEELFNASLKEKETKLEKIVTGKVISITSDGEIFVDIGYKADGIIPKREYSDDENANPKDQFKVGDNITAMVLKMNDGVGNVLLSYKRIKYDLEKKDRKQKQDEFWANCEVGKEYEGTVAALSSYGAFVDLGMVQGLLHVSEISWDRNVKPDQILKQGQQIRVTIKDLDKENKRIKLSYVDKGPNPWSLAIDKYHVGDIVKVKVVKLMPFGAFVELEKGVEGLVHISQISEKRITKPEEELKENMHVNAKIIDINLDEQKIELSIKELEGTSNEYKEGEN